MALKTQSVYSSQQRSRRNRRRLLHRAGIACSFAAMTCWPMAVVANQPPEPPEWPATQEEIDAYIDALVDQANAIPSAVDYYASQEDPMILVQEYVRPDLNGDGIGDLVIPQPNLGPADTGMGRVGVISGWYGDLELHIDVSSDEAGDSFGSIVVGIPDIDGDQIDDLAVGAPTSSLGAALGGRVDVISGASGEVIFRIVGNEANGRLGSAVASAGDCNDDGINDLIVGEPHTDAVRGRAFVFYGAAGLGADGAVSRSPSDADLSLTDGLAGAQFGLGVAGVGDLDGDGLPELAVGSPNRWLVDPDDPTDGMIERMGALRVYSSVAGTHLFTINGEVENGWLGRAMLGMPDQDGDGRNELLFSAPGFPELEADPAPAGPPATDGHVYALTSGAIGLLAAGAELTVSDASFEFARPAGATFQFGQQLELGHDTDGDGAPEVLVYASQPVQAVVEDLGGIDLAALGIPLGLPIFTLETRTNVYSGADHAYLYSYVTGEGSGVEINIPYPGPVVEEQIGQITPIGDVDLDMDVDAVDLGITIANVGQPTASSPTTDINQSGITEVEDVEIITDIIAMEAGIEDCLERVENGEFETVCLCLEGEYGIDPGALTNEEMDCGGDGEPEEGPGEGGGCDSPSSEDPLANHFSDCLNYATCVAGDEFDAAIAAACDAMAAASSEAASQLSNALRSPSMSTARATSQAAAAEASRQAEAEILASLGQGVEAVGGVSAIGTVVAIGGAIIISSNPVSLAVVGYIVFTGGITFFTGSGVLVGSAHQQVAEARADILAASQGNPGQPAQAPQGVTQAAWNSVTSSGSAYSAAYAAMVANVQAILDFWTPIIESLEAEKDNLEEQKEERRLDIWTDCMACLLDDDNGCTEYEAN